MEIQQRQFRFYINALEKEFGPQGWWPRLVVGRESFAVKHHPGPKSHWLSKSAMDQAFEVAVGAILTQNTSWTNVEKTLVCLAEKGLMTSASLTKARLPYIESCVRSSGYYRQKAKKLKLFAKFVHNELGGDLHKIMSSRGTRSAGDRLRGRREIFELEQLPRVPFGRSLRVGRDDNLLKVRAKLLSLWGIGPETADTILLYGLNLPVFVVDAYTRRLLVHLTGDASLLVQPYDVIRKFCERAFAVNEEPRSMVKTCQEAHAVIVRWGKERLRLRIS